MPVPALNVFPEQELNTVMDPAIRCTSFVEVVAAVLLANLWPINVIDVAEFWTSIAPAVDDAVFEDSTHAVEVRVEASTFMAPPDTALLLVKVHFNNVAVEDTRLRPPPFPAAAFPETVEKLTVITEEPTT